MAQLGKLDAPRQRRRFTPATTGGKTSLAAEEVTNGDSGRASVGGFPPRQLVALHQEVTSNDRAEQSTIKHPSGAEEIQRQQRPRVVAILGLDEQHQDLRTDQRRQQHPQAEIVDAFAWQPVAFRQLDRDQNPSQKRDREKHAVGIDWETADAKKLRVHVLSALSLVLVLCENKEQSTKNKAHGDTVTAFRFPKNISTINNTAPMQILASAILKVGQ